MQSQGIALASRGGSAAQAGDIGCAEQRLASQDVSRRGISLARVRYGVHSAASII